MTRRMQDVPAEGRFRLDFVGAVLSALGLGSLVFGVLRSGEWGWVQPKPAAPAWLGLSPTALADPRRARRDRLFLAWEDRVLAAGREPLVRTALLRNARLRRRPDHVLLPVPAPGRAVLHGAAVPVRRARAVGVRDRAAADAALGHPAPRRPRHPQVLPAASPRTVVRWGLLAAARRHPVADRRPRGRRRGRGRHGAAAARRARRRGAGLPAGRGDGLGGPRRGERRGRRAAEHDDEPGRVARHRAGRVDPDRPGSPRRFLQGIEQNPDVPDQLVATAAGRAGRRDPLHVRRRPRGGAAGGRPARTPGRRDRGRERDGADLSAPGQPGCARAARAGQPVLHPAGADRPGRRRQGGRAG